MCAFLFVIEKNNMVVNCSKRNRSIKINVENKKTCKGLDNVDRAIEHKEEVNIDELVTTGVIYSLHKKLRLFHISERSFCLYTLLLMSALNSVRNIYEGRRYVCGEVCVSERVVNDVRAKLNIPKHSKKL